ncbi:DBH-like monooxygenase protein 1 isoform X1 [Branchiostoma floridae]|uniref:DBH-like monooxygenase protein 1 isoform X1 n=1 Tax=Branchiostoma floridae TaxID=7739 RepID=A0A9J7LWM2_BRAFL|nr:DBH-like monooxygenase protein 1 isoform X1 [Branchiostoma floridae]
MTAFWTSLRLVVAVAVLSATRLEAKFTHSAYLDAAREKYFLQWRYDAETITFRVEVATLGYVGFGISPNGDMTGSDIVTGFVTDQGDTFFFDRYATARAMPTIDSSQDWTLESSGENGTHTFLQFSRKLVLCDHTDRTIEAGTTRVIWAYHGEDPPHDTELMYHGETRGARSLMLLSGPQNAELPEQVQTMEFLNDAYAVPYKKVTNYLYRGFKVPDLGGKKHVIAFEPVVQAGNEAVIHHMFLYACLEDLDPNLYDGVQYLRESRDIPADWRSCKVTIIVWDVGGVGMHYPEKVGLSVGAPGDPTFLLMETHYNNAQRKKGMKDSSGIRLLYTSELREYDLGLMQLGMEVGHTQIIPPGSQSFVSVGNCYPDCLEKAMEAESIDKINVIGVHFHAHLAARKMRVRHVRNGVELPWLGNDENFDFNFQQTIRLQKEREVLKGDYLIVECTYDTTDREEITHGGPNTQDEMYLGHILHYPKMKLRRCKSNPHRVAYLEALGATEVMFRAGKDDFVPIQPPQMAGKSMKKLLHSVSWNEELRQKFQAVQRTGKTSVICMKKDNSWEEFHQQTLTMREPPPVILHPFEETDACKTQGTGASRLKMRQGSKKSINGVHGHEANAENKSGIKKGSRRKTRKNHRKLSLSPWRHHRRARKISW